MISKVLDSTTNVIKASKDVPAENLAIGFLGVIAVVVVVQILGVVVMSAVR